MTATITLVTGATVVAGSSDGMIHVGHHGRRCARHTAMHRARACEEQHRDHEQNANSALLYPESAPSEGHLNIIGVAGPRVKLARRWSVRSLSGPRSQPHRARAGWVPLVRAVNRATHQPRWAISSTATRARPSGMTIFGMVTWSFLGKSTRKPWGISHIGPWANPGRHAVSLTS